MKYYPNYNLIRQIVGRGFYNHNALKQAYNILYDRYIKLFKQSVTIIEIQSNSTLTNYIYSPNGFYSNYKALIYNDYISTGAGPGADLATDMTSGVVEAIGGDGIWSPVVEAFSGASPTDSPLNRAGLWFNTATDFGPFTFTITLNSECDKDLYVGVGTDNFYEFVVNGTTVVDNTGITDDPYYDNFTDFGYSLTDSFWRPFMHWHIYPLHLNKGVNTLQLSGINPDGGEGGSAGYMGLELYDDSKQAIKNTVLDPAFIADPVNYPFDKNYYTNLNMIFSTRYLKSNDNIIIGEPFTITLQDPYICPTSNSDKMVVTAQTIANKSTVISAQLKAEYEKILNFLFNKIENCCP